MSSALKIPLQQLIFNLKHGSRYVAVDNDGKSYQVIKAPTAEGRAAAWHLEQMADTIDRFTNLALTLQSENDKLLAELIEKNSNNSSKVSDTDK